MDAISCWQQVLALIAELEARLDFDEDLPTMDAQRLQGQVCSKQCVPFFVSLSMISFSKISYINIQYSFLFIAFF